MKAEKRAKKLIKKYGIDIAKDIAKMIYNVHDRYIDATYQYINDNGEIYQNIDLFGYWYDVIDCINKIKSEAKNESKNNTADFQKELLSEIKKIAPFVEKHEQQGAWCNEWVKKYGKCQSE